MNKTSILVLFLMLCSGLVFILSFQAPTPLTGQVTTPIPTSSTPLTNNSTTFQLPPNLNPRYGQEAQALATLAGRSSDTFAEKLGIWILKVQAVSIGALTYLSAGYITSGTLFFTYF